MNDSELMNLAVKLGARHNLSVVDVLAVLSSKEARARCSGLRSLFHPNGANGKNGKNDGDGNNGTNGKSSTRTLPLPEATTSR